MSTFLFLRAHWRLIVYTLTAFVCFGAGWRARGEIELADQARSAMRQAEQRQQIDQKAAAELASVQKRNRELARKIRYELQNLDYTTCRVPLSGVQLRNSAMADSPSEPDAALRGNPPAPR